MPSATQGVRQVLQEPEADFVGLGCIPPLGVFEEKVGQLDQLDVLGRLGQALGRHEAVVLRPRLLLIMPQGNLPLADLDIPTTLATRPRLRRLMAASSGLENHCQDSARSGEHAQGIRRNLLIFNEIVNPPRSARPASPGGRRWPRDRGTGRRRRTGRACRAGSRPPPSRSRGRS